MIYIIILITIIIISCLIKRKEHYIEEGQCNCCKCGWMPCSKCNPLKCCNNSFTYDRYTFS